MQNKKIFVDYNSPLEVGDKMNIRLRISNDLGFVNEAKALINRNGEKPGASGNVHLIYDKECSDKEYSVFKGNVIFDTPGYRTFYIQLKLNGVQKDIKYDSYNDEVVISNDNCFSFWELFVYYPLFNIPDWIKGGIMYQIFIDTFCCESIPEHLKGKVVEWNHDPKWEPEQDGVYRNNQFYGGNLKGIIKKLPYIKSLGVTAIYLTPIFKSSSSNRYDIDDYEEIDELVGTWDDMDELHKKANELGMYIVLDLVFNHSGRYNKLFKENPDMYDWIQKYTIPKCWWGYDNLVEFNKNSMEYFIKLAEWLQKYSKYVDGIRLDVADNLPDFVLKYIRSNFYKYILAEIWKNAITGEFREFLFGDEVDGVMNYQFANAIIRYARWKNWKDLKTLVKGILKLYPPEALDASPIFLSSHDTPRIQNSLVGDFMKESMNYETVWAMEEDAYWRDEYGNFDTYKFRKWEFVNSDIPEEKKKLAIDLQKVSVFMQYTFPGLPAIFAGDEVGLAGFKDPFNRKPFPWDNINQDLYEFYCTMGKFRNKYKEIFSDSRNFKIILIDDEKMIYKRNEFIFIVNVTDKDLMLDEEYKTKEFVFTYQLQNLKNIVPKYGAIVVK